MSILSRYVIGLYLAGFGSVLALGTVLSTTIDFFNRISDFSQNQAQSDTILAYFALKLPSIIPEVFPLATLLGVLFSLGQLSRHHELLAMRACGIPSVRMLTPLLLTTAMLTTGIGVWNETVVPGTARSSRYLKDIVIKKKNDRGHYNVVSLWYQDSRGFVNVGYFDANRNALYGLTLYEATDAFELERVVEVDTAFWREGRWDYERGLVKTLQDDGSIHIRPLEPGEIEIGESPATLRRKQRRSDTFSFQQLLDRIDTLDSRGLDTSPFLTDLHAKVSTPFAGIVTFLVGFAIAQRDRRRPSVALNITLGLGLALIFWLTAAAAIAAGRNGAIHPVLAAWSANGLFLLVAGAMSMRWGAR